MIDKYKWLSEYHNIKFKELFPQEDYYKNAYKEMQESMCIDIDSIFTGFEK